MRRAWIPSSPSGKVISITNYYPTLAMPTIPTYRQLTEAEQDYLEQGGRVFLVGNANEVIILRKGETPFYLKDMEGKPNQYESHEKALEWAQRFAILSEDTPMVEGKITGFGQFS